MDLLNRKQIENDYWQQSKHYVHEDEVVDDD